MAPGSRLPSHKHVIAEEIYVIEGSALIGTVEASEGAYCRSEPESIHVAIVSPDGCTLLVLGSERDELLDDEPA
jgi:anti-sigma factor ChrR (cupin superfamily)